MAAKTMDDIARTLAALRFKRRLLGGVDEDDVLRKLEMLQAEYRSCMEAAEQRCGGLIDERDRIIKKLRAENRELKDRLAGGSDGLGG